MFNSELNSNLGVIFKSGEFNSVANEWTTVDLGFEPDFVIVFNQNNKGYISIYNRILYPGEYFFRNEYGSLSSTINEGKFNITSNGFSFYWTVYPKKCTYYAFKMQSNS